jgi:hypothetical protein
MRRIAVIGLVLLGLLAGAPAASAAPTVLKAYLTVAESSAPVGTEVGFTLTVTLAGKPVKGATVALQVRDERGVWRSIDSYRTNRAGMVADTLTGYVPGYIGRYRALVVGTNRAVLARSNQVAVSWTAKGNTGREPQ